MEEEMIPLYPDRLYHVRNIQLGKFWGFFFFLGGRIITESLLFAEQQLRGMVEASSISQHAPDEQQEYAFNKSPVHRRPDTKDCVLGLGLIFCRIITGVSFVTFIEEVRTLKQGDEHILSPRQR